MSLLEAFGKLEDPRLDRNKRHLLIDIVVVAICGTVCGVDEWTEIEEFGRSKIEWFKSFLELPNGIPSHDTFGRVFSLINPEQFEACFREWVASVNQVVKKQLIAIDGKTLRKSHDRQTGKSAIHLVSAWASENQLVLGQLKTEEKSNEITAIPELLKGLAIEGCIISIDAMGCQKSIARQIREQGADYVFSLKGNPGTLHEDVKLYLDTEIAKPENQLTYSESVDAGHDRIEIRRCWVSTEVDWLEQKNQWKDLGAICAVERERIQAGKTALERSYYISSLVVIACLMATLIRQHWGIENQLHWLLDVGFREDANRTRKGHAAENMALLRRIALNLLKQEKTLKRGIKTKRLKAGWDKQYLLKVLGC